MKILVQNPDIKKAKRKRHVEMQYQLDAADQRLLEQLLKHPSTPLRELAALSSLSISGVKKRIDRPYFKKALAEASGFTAGRLHVVSAIALRRLEALLGSNDERIALSAVSLTIEMMSKLLPQSSTPSRITYRTSIASDGRLLQELLESPEVGDTILENAV